MKESIRQEECWVACFGHQPVFAYDNLTTNNKGKAFQEGSHTSLKGMMDVLPSSAQAPVQLNWAELAILSLLNTHPPTRDSIQTAGWEADIQQASLF